MVLPTAASPQRPPTLSLSAPTGAYLQFQRFFIPRPELFSGSGVRAWDERGVKADVEITDRDWVAGSGRRDGLGRPLMVVRGASAGVHLARLRDRLTNTIDSSVLLDWRPFAGAIPPRLVPAAIGLLRFARPANRRWAIVTSTAESDIALARAFQLRAASRGQTVGVFTDLAPAVSWLVLPQSREDSLANGGPERPRSGGRFA